jgi:hypothetical protein
MSSRGGPDAFRVVPPPSRRPGRRSFRPWPDGGPPAETDEWARARGFGAVAGEIRRGGGAAGYVLCLPGPDGLVAEAVGPFATPACAGRYATAAGLGGGQIVPCRAPSPPPELSPP